jgi:hypothetical protein
MTIDVEAMTPDEIESELRRVIGALSYEVDKAIADDVYKRMHELIRQAALPVEAEREAHAETTAQFEEYHTLATRLFEDLDAEREKVRVLQEFLMRIDNAVMGAGHWCYDYDTAEGQRIADAVHVIWREAREKGLLSLAVADAKEEVRDDD